MTKLQHNQTFKLAVILAVGLAVFMGAISVNGNNLLPKNNNILSKLQDNKPTYDDTNGLICPEDISTYTDLNSCSSVISSGLNLEDPNGTIKQLSWHMTGATEGSSGNSGINQIGSYSFNEGTTVITYNGTDGYNKPIFCTFTVTITDNQVPKFVNPLKAITVAAKKGDCGAEVIWSVPKVIDNCNSAQQIHISCSHESGSWFPVGETNVIYTLDDGVEGEYSFSIRVVDNEIPVFVAPDKNNVVFGNAVPEAFTSYREFENAGGIASDNCGLDAKSFRFIRETRTGSVSPFTVTRTFQIADENGNITRIDHHIQVEKEIVGLKSGQIDITAISGNWSNTATWGGTLPNSGDNVTIPTGVTVTVDITTAVCNNITIQSGGTLIITGSNALSVYGNWSNSGTFTPGTDGTVVFTGTSDATISGTTTFENLQVTKGSISTTLNITGDVTVSSGGLLTMNSGLVTIPSGGSLDLDYSSGLTIPNTAGFDVTGGTLSTGNFSITNNGLIRVSSGTANLGVNSGNTVHTQNTGAFIVANGTVNIAGRLESTADGTLNPPGVNSGITISGGTVTLSTAGNNLSGVGSLNVTSSGDFSFTGGTIVFQNPSTASPELDLGLIDGTGVKNTTGGTFQFGNASTPAGSTFTISSNIPLDRITSSANADLILQSDLLVTNLDLNSATTIDLNGNSLLQTITGTGTYSFPLDDGVGNDISVSINLSSVSSFGSDPYIEITSTDGKYTNNASSTNFLSRFWTITLNDINGPTYSISADYPTIDISGTESEIAAGVWDGSSWTKYGAVSGGSLSASNISGTTIWITGITLDAPTVIAGANTPVCAGEAINLTATGSGDDPLSYSWTGPNSFTSSTQNPTISNASTAYSGTYTVIVTDGNGFTATDNIAITVNPLPVVWAPSDVCVGETETLSPTTGGTWTSSNNAIATVTNGGVITGVAAGSVSFTFEETATGCSNTTSNVTVNALPAAPTAGNVTVTYDGSSHTGTATPGAGETIDWYDASTGGNSTVAPSGTNVGTYTAWAESRNTSTGCVSNTRTQVTVTVNPAPITITVDAKSKTYGDSDPALTYQITSGALVLGDNFTGSLTRVAGENVGTYQIQQGSVVLSSNYTLTYVPNNLTITNIILTPAITTDNKCYDGTTSVILSSQTLTGVVSGDDVTLVVGSASFDNSNAGSGKTVTASGLSLSGADAANYTLSSTTATTTADIYPLPTPADPAIIICADETSTDLTGFNTTVLDGETGTVTWFDGDPGNGGTVIPNATGVNLNNVTDLWAQVTLTGTGCSDVVDATVTINPLPTATISGDATICEGDATTITITLTGTQPWSVTYTDGTTPVTQNNITSSTYTFSVSPLSNTTYTLINVSDVNCTGTTSGSAAVVVRPTPTATISGDNLVCQNITPAPLVWFHNPMDLPVTITYTRNSTPQAAKDVPANDSASVAVPVGSATTYNYSITEVFYQTAPTCREVISGQTATVVVNPTPVAGVNLSSQGICSEETISTILITGSGTTYNWTRDHAEVTGTIGTSGQGDISGTLTNPTTAAITVTFTIIPEANGCTGPPAIARVTVYPTPIVILTPDPPQTRCSGEPIASIVPTSPTGGTFTWVRDHVSDVTGIAASGTGPVPSTTVTNTTSEPITVSFIFTPTSAGGCVGIPDTTTILVNPTPYLIDTSEIICNDGNFNITPVDSIYGIVPDGTTYLWEVNSTSGGISGASDNDVPSTSIYGALTNSTNTTQYVIYAVTPYYGSCPRGELFYLTVYVTPEPDINDLTTNACSGESFTVNPLNNTDGIVPSGTTYDWVAISSPPGITGASDGSGTGITDSLVNTTNSGLVVSYTVTPTAGSCGGTPFNLDVTVKPAPGIDNLTVEACSDETFTVTPQDGTSDGIVPTGTTYSWPIPSTSGGISGGSPGSGASSISGTLTNSTSLPQTATYIVTPSVNGCVGDTFTVVVTVNPKPAVNPMRDTICSGGDFDLTPLNGINGSIPAGTTTYSWPAPSVTGGITGGVSGSGSSINGTLINNTNSVQTATYTVTPTSGSCDGIVFTVIVRVDPAPSINDINATVCSGTPFSIIPLNGTDGFVPSGTVYSWNAPPVPAGINGVAAGSGSADISGTLTNSTSTALTVTYTVEAISTGCSPDTFDVNVTINPPISASISGSDTVCDNAGSTLVTFTNPTDQPVTVTYNINGGFNYTLDIAANDFSTVTASISAQGTFHYVLTSVEYQSDPLCQAVLDDTATIVVQPITTASISASATTICYSTPVTFTATVANAGTSPAYQWKINGVDTLGENSLTFTSSTLENGDVVTFEVETFDTPCPTITTSNPVTMTVTDLNIPEVTIYESANPVCEGTSVTFTADPVINGGSNPTFEWLVNGTSVSTGSNSTYSYTPSNGDQVAVVLTSSESCPGPPDTSNVIIMTVDPILPVSVILTVDSDTVCEGTGITFTAAPTNGGLNPIYKWSVNGSTTSISSDSTYSYIPQDGDVVNVELTSSEVCTSGNPAIATPINITVETPPTATAGGSATTCINSAYTLSVGEASASNGTILWTENGAGTITAGETTLTPTYTPAAGDEGNLVTLTMAVTSNNTCGSASDTAFYFINVDPLPVASAGGSDIICSNSSATVSGASASNGTILWTTNGSGSLINPTTLTPTYIADAADEGNDVILTMVVTSNNTCGTATDTAIYTITVDSLPTATTAGSSTICSDSILTLPFGAASASSGTISWSHDGAGNITAGANTLTPTYTPVAGDAGNIVTLTMTVTSDNTCNPATATANYTINVNTLSPATPGIISGEIDVCFNSTDITYSIAAVPDATNYSWSVPPGWTITSGQGTTSINVDASISDGNISVVAANTCGASSASILPVISVDDVPAQPDTIIGLSSICPGLSTVYTTPVVSGATSYIWTVPSGWIIESGQGTTSLSVTVPIGASTGVVTVRATNICGDSPAQTWSVTIANSASVYAGPDQIVCLGTETVIMAGQVDGKAIKNAGDWDWFVINDEGTIVSDKSLTSEFDLFNGGNTPGDYHVYIQSNVSAVGCDLVSDTMTITVLPNPTASISSSSPVCAGETTTVTFSGTPNTTVTYYIDAGADQTIDIDGTGSVTLTTATITASTTYNLVSVEYTDAPACSQPISGTTTITLDPQPIADAGTDQTICADDSVLLAGTITDAVSGTWSGGTGTFNPDATTLNAYYIPSAAEITAGSVTLTLTPSNPASSCSPVPDNVVISIDPLPTVEAGDPDTVCQSGSPDAIILSGATIGGGATTGSWSITSGGGNLSSTAQTANPGTVTYTPASNFSGTATLTLTTNASGECPAVSDTKIIVVEPAPTVVAGSPDTVCQEVIPSPITLAGASVEGGATTGAWSIVSGGGSLGFTSATENPDTVTYTPATNFTGTVTLRLTTDAYGTCDAVSATRTITIRPAPTVDAGATQTICADDSVYLAGSVGGSATSGTWSGGAGSFNPNATTLNAVYKPTAGEIAAGSVTLTLTTDDPPGLCDAVFEDVIINIDPTVTVDAGSNDTICQGDVVSLTGIISGGTNSGSWVGGAGTFNPGRSNLNATYTPSAAEVAAGSVLLTLTSADPAGACGPQSDTTRIVIYKAVVITAQPVNTGACVGDSVALTVVATGSQLSYQWYKDGLPVGTNSPSFQIDPVSLADDGSYYVIVSGASGCSSKTSNTVTLNVDAAITISSQPASQTECEGADVIFNVIASANGIPLNYQWRKDGTEIPGATNSDYFITGITTADAGDYDVIITGQGNFTCDSTVSAPATLSIGTDGTISQPVNKDTTLCENTALDIISFTLGGSASSVNLTGFLPSGVTLDSLGGGIFTISGTPTQTGTFDYTLTTTGSTCNNPSVSGTIVVEGQGTIILAGGNDSIDLCINNPLPTISYLIGGNADSASITAGSLPPGINGSYNSTNGLFTISGTPTTTGTYPFTVTTFGSLCDNPELSGEITVTPDATIQLTSGSDNQALCIGSAISPLTYTIGGSAASAVIASGALPNGVALNYVNDSVYTISGTPTQAGTFNFVVSTTGACLNVSDTAVIIIEPIPIGGVISPSEFKVCTEINNGTLTLQSYTGNILRWESSIDAGYSWQTIANTSDTYTYTNLPQFTQFRAVVGNATCGEVYSDTARIVVIPSFTPVITAIGGDVCSGEPITLTATAFILPDTVGIITGGDFGHANPKGWRITEFGVEIKFPSDGDNTKPSPFAESKNEKDFCGLPYNSDDDHKYAITNGIMTSTMETPIFSLVGMPDAALAFSHAYNLEPGTIAKIEISTDGGNTYNQTLATYTGTSPSLYATPYNIIDDVNVDLSPYLGMTNLRIRFNFESTTCSVWAIDGITLPTPEPDIEYEWGPVEEIPGGTGQTVVVVPPTTTTYTLTVYVAGCPGTATWYEVNVVDNPEVTTVSSCVGGDPVTFTQNTSYEGSWYVDGGGYIDPATGVFTADSAGCFVATFTTISGDCSGSASFIVYPQAPIPDVNEGCGPIVVTPPPSIEGFDIQYSFNGGATWGPNIPPTADNCDGYHIMTRYITSALCDTIPIGTVSGCSISAEFIRVVDNNKPSFTVPNDTTISIINSCGYDADPSVTGYPTDEWDECTSTLEATYTDIKDSSACEIIITRYWTLTDDCDNDTTQIQIIRVIDGISPVINPEAQDASIQCSTSDPDQDPTYLAWLADHGGARASDPCDLNLVWTVDTADTDWVGIAGNAQRTVTFIVTDQCGNADSTVATFSISDDVPPTITCPGDVETLIAADSCSSDTFAIGIGTAIDDCSVPDLEWTLSGATSGSGTGLVNGERFNIGITTVHYTAIDGAGLTDTCSFTVWVKHLDVPTANITCPDDSVWVAADEVLCEANVPLDAPLYTDPCNEIDSVWNNSPYRTSSADASGTYPIGTTEFKWFISDVSGNIDSTCTVKVVVGDVDPPQFTTCPDTIEGIIDEADCEITNFPLEQPTWTESCGADLLWIITPVTSATAPGSGIDFVPGSYSFSPGQTRITYVLTDAGGNTDTCSFIFWPKHQDFPTANITCPDDSTWIAADPLSCNADVVLGAPVITDPCNEIDSVWNNSPYGTSSANASGSYPIGTTEFKWFISDVSGNIDSSCVVKVVVGDVDPPEFTSCPDTIEGIIDAADCEITNFPLEEPTWNEICGADLTYIITPVTSATAPGTGSGLVPSSYAFSPGQTRITYVLTDSGNNTDTCSFIFWPKHQNFPTSNITCPADSVWATADADCYADVQLDTVIWTDPCNEIDSIWNNSPYRTSLSDASGTYPIGATDFAWYILDVSGNMDSCNVTVIVEDDTAPYFTFCPSDTLEDIINDVDCDMTNFTLVNPTYEVGCGADLRWILSGATNNSGTGLIDPSVVAFNVGITTITYILEDESNNADTCIYWAWAKRANFPTASITCPPASVSVPADPATCDAFVELDTVAWTDPCNEIDSIWNNSPYQTSYADASGRYPIGTTNFSWFILDVSGNIYNCDVAVTVTDTTSPNITGVTDIIECPEFVVVAGDTQLDLDTLLITDDCADNCSLEEYTMRWRIDFADGSSLPGGSGTYNTGLISEYGTDILFPADSVTYTTFVHSISYWVVDCSGNVSASEIRSVSVYPPPTAIPPADTLSYCYGDTVPAITLEGYPAGDVVFDVSGGSSLGIPDMTGVTEIPSFWATSTGTATIGITPRANGCVGSPVTFVLIITEPVTVSVSPVFQTICSGATTNIHLMSSNSGASFSYVVSSMSPAGSVIGAVDSTGEYIRHTLINTTQSPATITYTVTATANGCTSPGTANATVTINPTPELIITEPDTVCEPEIVDITAPEITAGSASGLTFTYWIDSAATLSLSNPSAVDQSGTYFIKASSGAGCEAFDSVHVVINPLPTLTSPLNPTGVCSNELFEYVPSSSIPGTEFEWTRAAIAGISNPAESGTDSIREYLVNTTTDPIAVVYQYTLIVNGCSSIEEVVVMVTPTPDLTSTQTPPAICSGTTFSYTPSSNVSGTTFPWTRAAVAGISNPAASGEGDPNEVLINTTSNPIGVTYEYTLTSNDCANPVIFPVYVIVVPSPNVTAWADPVQICPGESIDLFSTSDVVSTKDPVILSEDFNSASVGATSGPNGWTSANNSWGGTTSNAAWTVRQDNYYYGRTFSSNDDSQFYLSNSDSQGSGSHTRTTLVSPVMNTEGYSDLQLEFYHYYRSYSSAAYVEVSTDGVNWTTAAVYYSGDGSSTSFSHETISLNGYVGSSSFYVRFRYEADWGWYWAIDNVTVTGTPVAAANVTWTSIPAGFTSNEANPANVYPTQTTTYIAEYTDPDTNCPGYDSVTVIVRDLPNARIDADYCIIPDEIVLTASGGTSYLWSTGETTQTITIDMVDIYSVLVTDAFGCQKTAYTSVSEEQVIDGTFTNFNGAAPSFYSQYIYHPNNPSVNNELVDDSGYNGYSVGTDGQDFHYDFWGFDHTHNTTGDRNYMIVNGHEDIVIWEQEVTVFPNTDYYFSAWARSLNDFGPYARLQFEVNGVLVGTIANLGAGPGNASQAANSDNYWVHFYSNPLWNSGSTSGTIVIRIVNLESALGGNDFGIDDISFGTLDPLPSVVEAISNSPICEGDSIHLSMTVTNGKEPFTYNWTGPNGYTASGQQVSIPNADPSYSGDYIAVVTDGYGCGPVYDTVTVLVDSIAIVNAGPDQEVCASEPDVQLAGSISGSATSATWSGGTGTFSDSTALDAVYTLSAADTAVGLVELVLTTNDPVGVCGQATDTMLILINPEVNIVLDTAIDPLCPGSSDGEITVHGIDGTAPYSYEWNTIPVQTTRTASNLPQGTYTVTVTDINGCWDTLSVTIIDPDPLVVDSISFTEPLCYNGNDGTATVVIESGDNPTFVWSNGDTTATADSLSAGMYTVTVYAENWCTAVTLPIAINQPDPPTVDCPEDIVVYADFGSDTASNVALQAPVYENECPLESETWILSGVTIDSSAQTGIDTLWMHDFNLGVTTITYTFTDIVGNISICDFTVTVLAAPVIECPPDTTIYLDGSEGTCEATFDPGVADLIEGAPPITWTYTITFPDSTTQTDTYIKDASDPEPNPLGTMSFPLGVTTIEWRAENIAGFDTCSHWIEVIDTIPPDFTTAPYENCVDPLHWVVYNESNPNPSLEDTEHIDPNLEKQPVDYRTMYAGDTFLDLTSLEDNCCDSISMADSIHWCIAYGDTYDPADGSVVSHDTICGTGQPSTYADPITGNPRDIYLWGDGVYFTTVTHHITYWVEDCNGNISEEITEEIIITPRPQVIKEDY